MNYIIIEIIKDNNKYIHEIVSEQVDGLTSYLSLQHQVLSFPVLEHLERLQGAHNVHWIDSSLLTDLCASSTYNNSKYVYLLC